MTLIEQINASANIADLDDAVRPIQELLGVTDGGRAAIYFSGCGFDRIWPDALHTWRRMALVDYIAFELKWAV